MRFLKDLLTDKTALTVLGFFAVAAVLLLLSSLLRFSVLWVLAGLALMIVSWLMYDFRRKRQARRSGEALGAMLEQQAHYSSAHEIPARAPDTTVLRQRMLEAIRTIKTSKLGEHAGAAALYELPWYLVIGQPADGKSSAIANSGLQFPFADQRGRIIQGVGGTRNCDWFFTTEGILLDTAGRYSVQDEDRSEWLAFLALLKKHRPKAPINGIVIAAGVAELAQCAPDHIVALARQLRERLQELSTALGVFAPVYVMFTKADLISGFVEFFKDSDALERERVWGATLAYDAAGQQDAVAQFDTQFDHLYAGLKELSLARMALHRDAMLGAGVLAFPLEFASLKPALRCFIATLFHDNPFQHRPVFRGFYFSSALQEGIARSSSSRRVTERFGLTSSLSPESAVQTSNGFFLKELFSKVIFADRDLVRQYANPRAVRLRYAAFFGSVAALGLLLAIWTWSYVGNQQLVANSAADLAAAVKLQEGRTDLGSRLEALGILQDRVEQLEDYRESHPLALSWGLYQGDAIEKKLRSEYFSGVQQVMLKPVAATIEGFLSEVNANAGQLEPLAKLPQTATPGAPSAAKPAAGVQPSLTPYQDLSPTKVEDAYNALKTYIMLGERERLESGHLNDQLTRFWRGWLEANRGTLPREEMIRRAEQLIAFTLTQTAAADYPLIDPKLLLVDQTRETLRGVVKGLPARERVYAEIKARAATRYPAVTIAGLMDAADRELIVGSHAISGAFTRRAWFGFVKPAIDDAANKELQSTDWVLKTAASNDLTLEGSPEQIEKELVSLYKAEYIQEWHRFLQGVAITEFAGFDDAVKRMNRLGDPTNSPINSVLTTLFDETTWDNPSLVKQGIGKARTGLLQWFRNLIGSPSAHLGVASGGNIQIKLDEPQQGEVAMGPIGKEFAAISQLVVSRGHAGEASLLKGYLAGLSKVRTRFNQIKNGGDVGPASRQLMQQTLEGSGSELAESLRFVDESMLTGLSDSAKQTIRPLLVRPLIQAYAVIVKPTEEEINKVWAAQVHGPFMQTLADKYPFAPDSRIEAHASEIATLFGPAGAISKFTEGTLGALVTRRGDTLTPRTWADVGLQLSPLFMAQFARMVGEQSGADAAAGSTAQQTVFQIEPIAVPGVTEYSIEIDGQRLRYRNTPPEWVSFVWPNPSGSPGARVTAVTYEGRSIEVTNSPGRYGLEKLISSAQRSRKPDGSFLLSWTESTVTVSVHLRIISSPSSAAPAAGGQTNAGLRGVVLPPRVAGAP